MKIVKTTILLMEMVVQVLVKKKVVIFVIEMSQFQNAFLSKYKYVETLFLILMRNAMMETQILMMGVIQIAKLKTDMNAKTINANLFVEMVKLLAKKLVTLEKVIAVQQIV